MYSKEIHDGMGSPVQMVQDVVLGALSVVLMLMQQYRRGELSE